MTVVGAVAGSWFVYLGTTKKTRHDAQLEREKLKRDDQRYADQRFRETMQEVDLLRERIMKLEEERFQRDKMIANYKAFEVYAGVLTEIMVKAGLDVPTPPIKYFNGDG